MVVGTRRCSARSRVLGATRRVHVSRGGIRAERVARACSSRRDSRPTHRLVVGRSGGRMESTSAGRRLSASLCDAQHTFAVVATSTSTTASSPLALAAIAAADDDDDCAPPAEKRRLISVETSVESGAECRRKLSSRERHRLLLSAIVAPSRSRVSSPVRQMLRRRDGFKPTATSGGDETIDQRVSSLESTHSGYLISSQPSSLCPLPSCRLDYCRRYERTRSQHHH